MANIVLNVFYRSLAWFCSFVSWIYPVKKEDAERVVILFVLFFLVAFVYNTLLPLKKSIIMFTPGAGAEALTYLKPFAVTPGSLLFTWYFLSLDRVFDRDRVFGIVILTFLSYFVAYTFIFCPYKEFFALNALADCLETVLPASFQAAPALVRYWMHTLFYTFAELWSTTVLSLLLWGLVNEISTHEQAKSTYALFTVGANLSSVFSGMISARLGKIPFDPSFLYGQTKWDQYFFRVMLVVLTVCFLILVLYRYFVGRGYTSAMKADSLKKRICAYQSKKTISILDCFYQVFQSKNLIYLTIIVMGYNLVYNLSDVAFNKRVQLSFGPENIVDSNAFLSSVQMYTGIVSTFFALIVTNLSLHYLGWTFTALLTPAAYFSTGLFFYLSQIDMFIPMFPSMDLFALYAGGVHLCLTKGSKYSFFDSTKEMAYIGLTKEERTNGKAAIDGIASRLGKSGGSFLLLGLFTIFGNDIIKTIPYLFMMIVVMNVLWVIAILKFGTHIHETDGLKSPPL